MNLIDLLGSLSIKVWIPPKNSGVLIKTIRMRFLQLDSSFSNQTLCTVHRLTPKHWNIHIGASEVNDMQYSGPFPNFLRDKLRRGVSFLMVSAQSTLLLYSRQNLKQIERMREISNLEWQHFTHCTVYIYIYIYIYICLSPVHVCSLLELFFIYFHTDINTKFFFFIKKCFWIQPSSYCVNLFTYQTHHLLIWHLLQWLYLPVKICSCLMWFKCNCLLKLRMSILSYSYQSVSACQSLFLFLSLSLYIYIIGPHARLK